MSGGRIVDDLAVAAPRPRTTDSLLEADMVRHKHALLSHLGLESRARPAEGRARRVAP